MNIFKKGKKTGIAIAVILFLALFLVMILLESIVKHFANERINAIPGYSGGIENINIDLWRGAYSIQKLRLDKDEGIKEDFLTIDRIDIAIRWRALFHGKIAAEIQLEKPSVIFAQTQTGEDVDWVELTNSMTPFDIIRFIVNDGTLTYLDYNAEPNIHLHIDSFNARITNISNVNNSDHKLPSNIFMSGNTIGGGALTLEGGMNILREIPDFDLSFKIENVAIPSLNDYFRKYASLDFKKGTLNVYSEIAVADGQVLGYVKPLTNDLEVVDLDQDENPLEIIWESMAAFFLEAFQNQPQDQFALKIPIEGNLSSPEQNLWPSLFSILSNAFVDAFKKNTDDTINLEDAQQQ